MAKKFQLKERRRISDIHNNGITKARFRILTTQVRWLSVYVINQRKPVHRFRRNEFLNYEVWRKERAKEFGKDIPQQTTINQEISTLRRCFAEVAVSNGYLTRDSTPELPKIKLPKDKKHRRDDLSENEWLMLEKCARLYWCKGLTRILDDEYTIEKNKNGSYKTITTINKVSARSKRQLLHRQLLYWGMRISMDTGIRIGSLRKMKWKHISENTTIPVEERKVWKSIDVPAENTKTGRSYRVSAPIARHLEQLRKCTKFVKPDDFLFINQKLGQPFSDRIFNDGLAEVLVEGRLADWAENDSNNCRKYNIHSGKNLTWYSFRHTYITMRLKAGTPLAIVAANTDTSLKYIQDHYFHYRADEATDELSKGRSKRLRSAMGAMSWVDAVVTEEQNS